MTQEELTALKVKLKLQGKDEYNVLFTDIGDAIIERFNTHPKVYKEIMVTPDGHLLLLHTDEYLLKNPKMLKPYIRRLRNAYYTEKSMSGFDNTDYLDKLKEEVIYLYEFELENRIQ